MLGKCKSDETQIYCLDLVFKLHCTAITDRLSIRSATETTVQPLGADTDDRDCDLQARVHSP